MELVIVLIITLVNDNPSTNSSTVDNTPSTSPIIVTNLQHYMEQKRVKNIIGIVGVKHL